MKDEIREFLQELVDCGFNQPLVDNITSDKAQWILDYITNLQEKCESLDEAYKNLQEELEEEKRIEQASLDTITNLQEENKRLRELDENYPIEEQLEEALKYERIYKTRIDKAREYIEENKELLDETTKLTELWLKEKEKIRKVIEYLEAPNRDNFDYCKAYMIQILQGSDE